VYVRSLGSMPFELIYGKKSVKVEETRGGRLYVFDGELKSLVHVH
jgi:hypothetical protein